MDRDTVFRQFNELEGKIEHLIRLCQSLEAANAELKDRNLVLEQKLQESKVAEEQHDEMKALIRSKIDNLMSKLGEFTEE